jgi:hypothetical protein
VWEVVDHGLPFSTTAGAGLFDPQINGGTDIVYGKGLFVLLGGNSNQDMLHWATSPDGVIWTAREQVPESEGGLTNGGKLHFDGETFSFFAAHTGIGAFVYTSTDGLSWTATQTPDIRPAEIASMDGVTMVASAGDVWTTTDYETWTLATQIAPANDLAAGAGRWVIPTNGAGDVYISEDGSEWDTATIEGIMPGGFSGVEFGRGVFILGGGNVYHTSSNGIDFVATQKTGSQFGITTGGAPRFVGNRFIYYRMGFMDAKTTFAASTDAVEWVDFGSEQVGIEGGAQNVFPADIAHGNCRYVMIANAITDGITSLFMISAAAPPAP